MQTTVDTSADTAPEPNPYTVGKFAPVAHETACELEAIEGEIPRDLFGAYVRNGPNPRFVAEGRYHPFDGDGMLHSVRFEDGRAFYANRFIRTAGLAEEEAAGRALWKGIRESARRETPAWPYKDTANTDVKLHHGVLVTSWYLCGIPYEVDPRSLETLGPATFGGKLKTRVSAHVKIDAATGDMMIFDYGLRPPFMSYGVVDRSGVLVHTADVPLPGPRLPHDMAITDRHSILMDLPVFPDVESLKKGRWRSGFHPDVPSRFAVLPRFGKTEDIRWFEASPAYIYHVVNSWDEDDAVVMIAHRVHPRSFEKVASLPSEHARFLQNLTMDAELYRYRFDLRTGRTSEEKLDDRNAEFPSIHAGMQGRKTRFGYAMEMPREGGLLFTGLVKYDTDTGAAEAHSFGPGVYGSEAPFAPREGANDEDDGYVATFVVDEGRGASELWIYDAKSIAKGPVVKLRIPVRMPLGFHACWAPGAEMRP